MKTQAWEPASPTILFPRELGLSNMKRIDVQSFSFILFCTAGTVEAFLHHFNEDFVKRS
jgi:hypothetical protein